MLHLQNPELLDRRSAVVALWLFARGADADIERVRRLVGATLEGGAGCPAHVGLGILPCAHRNALAVRDFFLNRAALALDPGGHKSLRDLANLMARRVPALADSIAAAWAVHGQAPESATDFERLVQAAAATGANLNISAASYRRILSAGS